MLQNQSVLARLGRKPRVHSEHDQPSRRQPWLEACLPAALYRRLFIRRLARQPLAIEGFSFRPSKIRHWAVHWRMCTSTRLYTCLAGHRVHRATAMEPQQ